MEVVQSFGMPLVNYGLYRQINMPSNPCLFLLREYSDDDTDGAIVAALLNAHSATDMPGHNVAAKVENVKIPTISAAG